MAASSINDPKDWYDRAAEMRALSEAMANAETRAIMLRLADDYDKLAESSRRARARRAQPADALNLVREARRALTERRLLGAAWR
jgi:hypothetical protein